MLLFVVVVLAIRIGHHMCAAAHDKVVYYPRALIFHTGIYDY